MISFQHLDYVSDMTGVFHIKRYAMNIVTPLRTSSLFPLKKCMLIPLENIVPQYLIKFLYCDFLTFNPHTEIVFWLRTVSLLALLSCLFHYLHKQEHCWIFYVLLSYWNLFFVSKMSHFLCN